MGSSLKDKKGITNTNAFQKIFDKSDRKPNKIWADKSSEIKIDQWDPSYKMMI